MLKKKQISSKLPAMHTNCRYIGDKWTKQKQNVINAQYIYSIDVDDNHIELKYTNTSKWTEKR